MITVLVWLIAGLAALTLGAEGLVRGGSALAGRLRVPPLVVGLTLVAFGTSAPECVVSTRAALSGSGTIALGNVVGSNIANVLLILGLAALVRPLRVDAKLVRLDIPLVIVASLGLLLVVADARISRVEGLALLVGLLVYTGWIVSAAVRNRNAAVSAEFAAVIPARPRGLAAQALLAAGGLALLVVGGGWFVRGAVELASRLGASEGLIGVTIVAVGTSLPELATSLLAAARGEGDIAIGNVVGSNLFNLLGILGVSAIIRPLDTTGIVALDYVALLIAALLLLPLAKSGLRLVRWEAALFLLTYAAYVAYRLATVPAP